MILDSTSKSLQIVLAAAVTTNQPSFSASYADLTTTTFTAGANDGVANGTTPVAVVAAPAASTQRQLKNLTIYNADTVNATVSVQLVDGANTRTLYKATLVPGASLQWTPDAGFTIPQTLTSNTPDFISGLKMSWNSATSISVSSGEAWIPGANALVQPNATLTLSGLSLSASTWYHVYLYNNAGTPAIECVTTAPASPYFGTARCKTGDTSRRYIGSVVTDSSGNIFNFLQVGKDIKYLSNVSVSPFIVVTAGTSTGITAISCAAVVPITSKSAMFFAGNSDTAQSVFINTSESGFTLSSSNWNAVITRGAQMAAPIPLDSSQSFNYLYGSTPTTGNLYMRVYGYTYER